MHFSQFKANRMSELFAEQWGAERIPGLLELLAVTKPRSVLEIGCFRGVSTEIWLLHCQRVVAVDPWTDEAIYRDFLARCVHYPHLRHVKEYSSDALKQLSDNRFDLIYIDGDHSYAALKADIAACRGLVAEGGFIAGHDYGGPGTPDVKLAVDEEFRKTVRFSDSSWLALNE